MTGESSQTSQQFTVPVTGAEPTKGSATARSIRLPDHEDPPTDRAEDARQWIGVYTAEI